MKVTIVIPNYNGKHFMKPCLDALERQTYREFEVLIVDNASLDGSLEYLKEAYPQYKVISQDKNYGFSHAVNTGIRLSETPYVILLNNDTEAEPRFVESLLKCIEKDRRIFSVGSKMLQLHHPELIDSAGDLYMILGWGVRRGLDRSKELFVQETEIFSACAGAAIYRRNVFEQIGYFDELHFAYMEDLDICYRAKIHGYRNVYCPWAEVMHVGSGTSGSKYNPFKVRLSSRNNLYLIYKNMPFLQLVLNFLPLLAGTAVKYLFFALSGYGKDYLDGLKEGWKTRKQCRKVPFRLRHLPNYIKIEIELIVNLFAYVGDWIIRKIGRQKM